jgi:hypothetical protein
LKDKVNDGMLVSKLLEDGGVSTSAGLTDANRL